MRSLFIIVSLFIVYSGFTDATEGSGEIEGLTFEWLRDEKKISPSSKMRISVLPDNFNSILRVIDLRPEDSGTYSCIARNSFGQDKTSTRLTVKAQLKWIQEPPKDAEYSAKRSVHIPCIASGQPEPKIEWRKLLDNGRQHQVIGPELHLSPIGQSDSGEYECRASNGVEEDLVSRLTLRVLAKATGRSKNISRTIQEVVKIVHDVLRELEIQEPRFISTFTEVNGHYEGLNVVSSSEFEVILFLNQMGVFNFVDDGSLPGCAVLKLSDGRKRSMSLWVEFITASGYLSARKIRSRFQTLMVQACEKSSYRSIIKLIPDTSEVKIRVRDAYTIQITPAFRCSGLWPRSASHWPQPNCPWPLQPIVQEVKSDGFDLLSKECMTAQRGKQSAMEGDAWLLSFNDAENKLLQGSNRKKCLSILKTLRDRNLDGPGQNCITTYHLKTLLLYECEKHPHEFEWDDYNLGDRINGILLQLISCLQSRRCPHYFLPNLDLFRGRPIENTSKQIWRLVRQFIMDPASLERL